MQTPLIVTEQQKQNIKTMLAWCAPSLNRQMIGQIILSDVEIFAFKQDGIVNYYSLFEVCYVCLYKTRLKYNRTYPNNPLKMEIPVVPNEKFIDEVFKILSIVSENFTIPIK